MYYNGQPVAIATVLGGDDFPELHGRILFYPQDGGTMVIAEVMGLPENKTGFYGFHIHEGDDCGGEDFKNTKGHLNPEAVNHPMHMGDLPPLLANYGNAKMTVVTGRFRVEEVIGKTIVIHEEPDDFRSQPAGNSGRKIACGVIRKP